ncbi:MAG: lipopolysaccharide heptosyltransferase II [Succinivibrionaceae bacterium]|nr:lipopolysaccharide heptosyltransferase II [Succinivibrionaceae bacterium]
MEPERYLIFAPSWLGDLIMAQSLFKVLKDQDPGRALDLFAPAYMRDLVARMPEIDRFIENPFAHGELSLRKRWQVGRELRKGGYSCCLVLPNSLKSALIPLFAGIRRRRGFRGESRYLLINEMRTNKQDFPRMVERYVALAYGPEVKGAADLPPFPSPALRAQPPSAALLSRLGIALDRPLLALGSGANYGPAKQWPLESFAEVASWWIGEGGAVLALGTRKDRPGAERIQELLPPGTGQFYCAAGETSLTEALDLAACCTAAVCNDSGMMHTLAAVGVPQACIFGSTSTQYTPPLSPRAVCLESTAPCHPCFRRTCARGDYQCLHEITPQAVISTLTSLVGGQD